jgi:membrane-associated phospholipid phosphatase
MRFCGLFIAASLIVAFASLRLFAQEESSASPESVQEDPPDATLEESDSPSPVAEAPHESTFTWYSMITNIPGDWIRTGELAFCPEGLATLGEIAIATGALMLGDHASYTFSHGVYTRSREIKFASNQIVRAGDGKITLGVAAAFALYGFTGGDSKALRTASGTVEALIASGVTVQILKRISGRESPQVATRWTGQWHPFPSLSAYNKNQPRYYAFPSGHLTTAMATVTVIAENYSEQGWIKPLGYGIVGLTAISLVNKGWHWYSDFPLAIALGYTFGHIAAHHDDTPPQNLTQPGGTSSLSMLPNVGPEGAGVRLVYVF